MQEKQGLYFEIDQLATKQISYLDRNYVKGTNLESYISDMTYIYVFVEMYINIYKIASIFIKAMLYFIYNIDYYYCLCNISLYLLYYEYACKIEPDKICLGNQACRPTNCRLYLKSCPGLSRIMILYIHQTAQDLGWFLHIYGQILPDQIMYSRRECAHCTVPREDCLRNGFSDVSAFIKK